MFSFTEVILHSCAAVEQVLYSTDTLFHSGLPAHCTCLGACQDLNRLFWSSVACEGHWITYHTVCAPCYKHCCCVN